ncbi:hypothetical protein B0H13DRAFT_1882298 [Mycena leptocephala]|nr:hypothetical protein B0H13DRAFT_1882298 [Mycena leptocephala]
MSVVLRIVPNSAPMSGWYEITFTHRSDIPTDSLGLQLLQDFGYNDSIKIQKAFLEDDQVISHLFREVVHSGKEKILHLTDEKATGFMDALHKVCIMASDDTPFVLPARRLLKDLCAAAKAFPPTLFLESDSVDTNRQIRRESTCYTRMTSEIFCNFLLPRDVFLLSPYSPSCFPRLGCLCPSVFCSLRERSEERFVIPSSSRSCTFPQLHIQRSPLLELRNCANFPVNGTAQCSTFRLQRKPAIVPFS